MASVKPPFHRKQQVCEKYSVQHHQMPTTQMYLWDFNVLDIIHLIYYNKLNTKVYESLLNTVLLHNISSWYRYALKTNTSNVVQDYVCFARGRHITVKCMNIKYTVKQVAGDTPAMTKQYTYISITTVCPLNISNSSKIPSNNKTELKQCTYIVHCI